MESEIPVEICSSRFLIIKKLGNDDLIHCSCWMSVDEGTIFGFVAPMLAIVLVSLTLVFIIIVSSQFDFMHWHTDQCYLYGAGFANFVESEKRPTQEAE